MRPDAVLSEIYLGCLIEVRIDEHAESPGTWDHDDVFLVSFLDRYLWQVRPGLDTPRQIADWTAGYHVFPVYAYIHSGIALSLGRAYPFNCPWDACQAGYVLVRKATPDGNPTEAAQGLVDEWNQYLEGGVLGYVTTRIDQEHLDSGWGFYSTLEEVLAEARQNCPVQGD